MANAHNQTAVTGTTADIFKSAASPFGGSDITNCSAFSVINDGAADLLLYVYGMHGFDTAGTPAFRLASGKSVTFESPMTGGFPIQLIRAVRATSTSTTISGGVVRTR